MRHRAPRINSAARNAVDPVRADSKPPPQKRWCSCSVGVGGCGPATGTAQCPTLAPAPGKYVVQVIFRRETSCFLFGSNTVPNFRAWRLRPVKREHICPQSVFFPPSPCPPLALTPCPSTPSIFRRPRACRQSASGGRVSPLRCVLAQCRCRPCRDRMLNPRKKNKLFTLWLWPKTVLEMQTISFPCLTLRFSGTSAQHFKNINVT